MVGKIMRPEDLAASGTEHAHQVALFAWAALERCNYPQLQLMFAIPNQRAGVVAGAYFKAEGVRAGVPDIFLPVPICRGPGAILKAGLWIELKKPGGIVAKERIWWQNALNEAGYLAVVCYGWEEARDTILTYLRY